MSSSVASSALSGEAKEKYASILSKFWEDCILLPYFLSVLSSSFSFFVYFSPLIQQDIRGILFGVLYAMAKENALGSGFMIASIVFEFVRILYNLLLFFLSFFHLSLFSLCLLFLFSIFSLSIFFLPLPFYVDYDEK